MSEIWRALYELKHVRLVCFYFIIIEFRCIFYEGFAGIFGAEFVVG
jgi:hypothetical protein